MALPGKRAAPDEAGRPRLRKVSAQTGGRQSCLRLPIGQRGAVKQHGSAELEYDHDDLDDCYTAPPTQPATRPQTPRRSTPPATPRSGEPQIHPGIGARLLSCEKWSKEFDRHCDRTGVVGYKDLRPLYRSSFRHSEIWMVGFDKDMPYCHTSLSNTFSTIKFWMLD